MSEQGTTIVLVGHCRPDAFGMRAALGRYAPGAVFVEVNDRDGVDAHAEAENTVFLVNRVLDGRFADSDGVGLLRSLPAAAVGRAALVSNLPEAQAAAQEAGAVPGFGKSEMYSDRARAAIEALVGATTAG